MDNGMRKLELQKMKRFLKPPKEDYASTGNLAGANSSKYLQPMFQPKGKASVPHRLKPLGSIQTRRDQPGVGNDIYHHSPKPLKAIHGVNMAAKSPLPPTRARATLPNIDAGKKPLKPVRPEGSPRRATSTVRSRRVLKPLISYRSTFEHEDDLPPCPEWMNKKCHPCQLDKYLSFLDTELIRGTYELVPMLSQEELDAMVQDFKEAKDKVLANNRRLVPDEGWRTW
ncbi:hypothetical protein DPEC_G00334940 [Dallia pectoralis]|uniref:Uncharacterized protein n=1 Tax=Dallia pectoralis TaxID=75939 RepID=A0ACC2F6T2_DALPE|nr:hypothetical protein DPEC_G00334940 [Dallia pectoralis]